MKEALLRAIRTYYADTGRKPKSIEIDSVSFDSLQYEIQNVDKQTCPGFNFSGGRFVNMDGVLVKEEPT